MGKSAASSGSQAGLAQPGKSARTLAALAISDVLDGKSLTEALEQRVVALSRQDQAFASELAYGTCRWYPRLNFIANELLSKGFKRRDNDVLALLLLGIYQLLFTRVPAHAAVGETSGAARQLGKKWAVSVINGVLRRLQRESSDLLALADANLNARYAQPGWIVQTVRDDWPTQWQQLLDALLQRPPMTLRINLARVGRDDYLQRLRAAGLDAVAHESVPSACILTEPVAVHKLPGFAEGLVSVQDAGAQLAATFLDVQSGNSVLDACAAPGGKTGHLLELDLDIQLTALDVDGRRLQRVAENLDRLGYQANLLAADATDTDGAWAEQQYDRILLDAPCSATGVMRRHPDIKMLRRKTDIAFLVSKQQQLMDAMWARLCSGGKMLYVTCSILTQENRMQVQRFIYNHKDAELQALPAIIDGNDFGDIQLPTGYQGMDGFYYALLVKK